MSDSSTYSAPSPKPAIIQVVVHDPPCEFDGCDWQGYTLVRLDSTQRVLLVASQGQEIRFSGGQSEPTGFSLGGDSRKASPSPSP